MARGGAVVDGCGLGRRSGWKRRRAGAAPSFYGELPDRRPIIDIRRIELVDGRRWPDAGRRFTITSAIRHHPGATDTMNPTDTLATAVSLVPAAIFVAILVSVVAIVWSVVATAEPSGPRTMDPAASWRGDF